jgi:uncharacterized protein (TIGR02996 family)
MTATADAAFVRAIVSAPGDDLPREIYADALEAGDCPGVPADPARAEFIRVQCELAKIPPTYQTCDCRIRFDRLVERCRWCTLRNRESRLRSICWPAIRSTLPPPHDKTAGWEHWRPARGFIFRVSLQLSEWLEVGPNIVGCHPIERVTLSDRQPHMQANRFVVWWRVRYGLATDADDLPPEIHDHLSGNRTTAVTIYRSEPEAFADLSAATIAWARSEHNRRLAAAGLLPVPWGCVREGVGT